MEQIEINESAGLSRITTPTSKTKFQIPEASGVIEKIEEVQEEEENLVSAFFIAALRIAIRKKKSSDAANDRRLAQELEKELESDKEEEQSCGCF